MPNEKKTSKLLFQLDLTFQVTLKMTGSFQILADIKPAVFICRTDKPFNVHSTGLNQYCPVL
jgi:hypothetical protein